jgi:hypothetical protein
VPWARALADCLSQGRDPGSILDLVRCVSDKVALGQVGAGHSGTGTDFSPTTSIVPHQDRYSNAPVSFIFAFSC